MTADRPPKHTTRTRPALTRCWAGFGTVRVRTTVAAVLVVGIALLVGALVLVSLLSRDLERSVQTAAFLRAEDVAALLESGRPPETLAVDDDEGSLVQVLDSDGQVITASDNVVGEGAVADLRPGEAGTVDDLSIDDGPYRVVALAAETDEGSLVVLVGRTLESVEEGVAAVTSSLWVGVPGLVLIVAATTWVVTGRALRPVETIRSGVAAIGASELRRRVPEPAGDDEIARLARTMNDMLARLETAQVRQQRFVSDAGHELRSPIASIQHLLEVALAHPDAVDLTELAEAVLTEDRRMAVLVADLLVLARFDERREPTRHRPVDLDDILLAESNRVSELSRVRVNVSGITAGQVVGDRALLVRMVRNLVDNAERHARTTVTLGLTSADGAVRLSVADDGPGIAVADRERVFERFTRLDDARTRAAGGYGLGLSIVANVVLAHGGGIRVGDAQGGGALFVVTLPGAGF